MNTIVWNKRYELGVDFIDREHKQLFATINKLLTLSQEDDKKEWACRESIKYLRNHTIEHFEHEESYMKSIDYPEYDIHKRLHDDFQFNTLPSLEDELERTDFAEESVRHFLGVIIGWLVAHTQTEDVAIAGKKLSKWSDIPQKEELGALEQTIVQIVDEMFQIKAKPISRQYGGEEFGKVLCCRFVYVGEKKEKWEILLSLEDKLLLKTTSDLMGTQYLKVDDLVVNIARYIARQFLEGIKECFPTLGDFKLESESLLTQEQVEKAFEREHPACSLLFDTGVGYFAFCVTTKDTLRGKISSPLNALNAMSQIKNYLAGENRKKKILVVDDSDFMRQSIINLLGHDYEMVESDSSMSAIKTLTLSRPDLILLDYEMPVCDGRQALEMIRSDKETADIPVVFLTGRGDADSVKKVMALKPRGYLLKSMPEADIKKYIDGLMVKL
ncbi:MAG: response regulator [Bacteroidales bacterium]|nr:response regulator [Bacteroidales bacterium]MCM1415244.1 response regulator [bacterium]MCM1423268.1 response regulator [bacterium]